MLGNLVSRLLGKPLGISIPNILQRWESFPIPLSPKHPLRTDNIGPNYRAYLFILEPSSKATNHNFPLSPGQPPRADSIGPLVAPTMAVIMILPLA